MEASSKYKNSASLLFVMIGVVYAFLIASNSRFFSPLDDFLFIGAFENGDWRGIQKAEFLSGRFNILHGLDLYFLSFLNHHSNTLIYYLFISLVFLFTLYIFYRIIQFEKFKGAAIGVFCVLLLISPSFTSIYFRLLYQERYVLLLFLGIIYLLIHLSKTKNKYIAAGIILLSNYVLYLKEPAIPAIFLLGFGLFLYAQLNKEATKLHLKVGYALMLSSIISLSIYLIFVFPHIGNRYGDNNMSVLINFIKSIVEWTIGDPLLFIVFIPLVIFRLIDFIKSKTISIYDVWALAGIGYMSSYFLLKMAYAQHYMTPVYAFAAPFVLYQLKLYPKARLLLIPMLIIQLGNISLGINDIIFQKQNNRNFTSVIETLDKITKTNFLENHSKTNFHVLGGQDQGNHFTYGALFFMLEKKNTSEMFDFSSFEPIQDFSNFDNSNLHPPFTFMNSSLKKSVQKGDYILYTPYTVLEPQKSEQYILIKEWRGTDFFGYLNLKDIVRKLGAKTTLTNNIRDKKSYKTANYSLYLVQ